MSLMSLMSFMPFTPSRALAAVLGSALVTTLTVATPVAPTAHAAGTDRPVVRLHASTGDAAPGDRVLVGGRVVGAAAPGGVVVLQERVEGRWQRLGARTAGTRGGFRFAVVPSEGTHSYRAKARRHAGLAPAVSPVRRVRVSTVDPALAEVRARILDETNAARSRRGLPALRPLAGADVVAQRWTVVLTGTGELAHNPSFAEQMPSGWTSAAENVAYGYEPDAVVDAWMESPGHRANILGDFTHLGIGFARDDQGRAWYTQNFGRY